MNEYDDSDFNENDQENNNDETNNLLGEEFVPRDETNEPGDFSSFSPELDEERRIEVDNETIKSIINDLKNNKNLSQKKISDIIGTNIKNIINSYTETMNEGSFKNLEILLGKEIKHKIIEKQKFTHETNESLAELIGIMLGDGHLNKDIYRQQISFNGIDEKRYMQYVKKKINSMFKINPKERWERNQKNATGNEKGMFLYIDNKNFFKELISHGLKPGNKVKNQVKVPVWIKKEKSNIAPCLKGLFDTDGSIVVVKKRSSLVLEFTNGSFPLVKDFKEMCESLDIKPSPKITRRIWKNEITGNSSISYKTTIARKDQILKFLHIIKPKKWEFNLEKIDKKLRAIGSSLTTYLSRHEEE